MEVAGVGEGAARAGEVPADPARCADPVPYLAALAERLRAEGWQEELVRQPGREPYLRVVNPVAVVLNEEITAAPTVPGLWWYWWSWGQRIGCVDNVDLVMDWITAVLGVG